MPLPPYLCRKCSMNIDLKLKYILPGVFDVSRWERSRSMVERSGLMDSKKAERTWMYADSVHVETHYEDTEDEYGKLVLTVSLASAVSALTDGDCRIVLNYSLKAPIILTFRVMEGYCETKSLEGGVTEEFVGNERGQLIWLNGEHIRL